jgi:hypothetical protein
MTAFTNTAQSAPYGIGAQPLAFSLCEDLGEDHPLLPVTISSEESD